MSEHASGSRRSAGSQLDFAGLGGHVTIDTDEVGHTTTIHGPAPAKGKADMVRFVGRALGR